VAHVAVRVVALAALAACAGDPAPVQPVEPTNPACGAEPGCGADLTLGLTRDVLDAVEDAATRLVASFDEPADRAHIGAPLQQLLAALTRRDALGARQALTATHAALDAVERSAPGAAIELSAIRLAMVPVARALVVPIASTGTVAGAVPATVSAAAPGPGSTR
jgi:hypothetical protein